MKPILVRVASTQVLLDTWKGQPFEWGKRDCVRLAAAAARAAGHKVKGFAKAGSYASEIGALRALRNLGFKTLEEMVDGQGYLRIPPAAALPGDVVGLKGEGNWTALCVALGNGRVLGFKEGRAGVMQPLELVCAWRIEPCPR
jgi:hypothetical protein